MTITRGFCCFLLLLLCLLAAVPGMAQYASRTFDASDFTADGIMEWNVTSANLETFRYEIDGTTMRINILVSMSEVVDIGTECVYLFIRIPEGKTPANKQVFPVSVTPNGITETALMILLPNTNLLIVQRFEQADWGDSPGNFNLAGNFEFEINP